MLGRRREDPRPPIEVIGDDRPDADSARRVQVGGDPGRRRGVLIAAVVAVLAIVGTGIAIGGDEEPEDRAERTTTSRDRTTRTTRPSTTSTAPVVTVPHGPQLAVPTGAALLLGRHAGGAWVHLDLDTGTRTELDLGTDGRSIGGLPVAVAGGVVLVDGTGARFRPLPDGEPVDLGRADQVYGSGPGAVWLVTGFSPQRVDDEPVVARLVDPRTGDRRSRDLRLPVDGYVAGASGGGLVVVAGGRLYLVRADGAIDPLGAGDVLATSSRYVVLARCDDRLRCGVSILEPATGAEQAVDGVPAPTPMFGRSALVSDEGQLVVLSFRPDHVEAWMRGAFEDGDGVVAELPGYGSEMGGWLPGRLGYVVANGAPGPVVRLTVEDGRLREVPFPAVAEDRVDFVVVIPS